MWEHGGEWEGLVSERASYVEPEATARWSGANGSDEKDVRWVDFRESRALILASLAPLRLEPASIRGAHCWTSYSPSYRLQYHHALS